MYIKTVVFGGFKSYRDQGLITKEEFSPMTNVLVGKNGSGKSNFFAAIQFVLGHGKYRHLSAQDRKGLLHEGTGKPVLSAFVEIHFDNSDGRLALETGDAKVVIRRTVGVKKDEYRINERTTSANEVYALLEAAGLSPSNPYNIVQQGKIAAFATMKDEQRFELLKEVAGTKVYEDRRAQSIKVLKQAEEDMKAIKENIRSIESRLSELSEEREEFKLYQQLERKQRCLQYCIHKRESDAAIAEIHATESAYANLQGSAQKNIDELHALNDKLKAAERASTEASLQLQQFKKQRELILAERQNWVKQSAKAQVMLTNAAADMKDEERLRIKAEADLAAVRKEIDDKKKKIEELKRELQKADQSSQKQEKELREVEVRVNQLLTKRGRHNQFSTRAERDKYLSNEIKKQTRAADEFSSELRKLKDQTSGTVKSISTLQQSIDKKRDELKKKAEEHKKKRELSDDFLKDRDTLAERRRALFRSQASCQQQIDSLTETVTMWEHRLQKTMPRDIRQGLQTVQDLVKEHNIKGVYGPVIDLFNTDKELFTAVDVMAGNALFHIVVEDNTVASTLLKLINQNGLPGRPSFYPLNRVKARPRELPTTEDCFPLYSRLSFDPKFTPVLADLFGKVLVCTNLVAAGAHSKTHNCDCVLPNGDKVDRRGGIQGGFLDNRITRMAAAVEMRHAKEQRTALEVKIKSMLQEAAELDQKMMETRSRLQSAEADVERFTRWHEREMLDLRASEAELSRLRALLQETARSSVAQQKCVQEANDAIAALKAEMETEMAQELSKDEAKELTEKQQRLDTMKKEAGSASAKADGLRVEVQTLEQALDENLLRREMELTVKLNTMSVQKESKLDARAEHEAKIIQSRIEVLDRELAEVDKALDKQAAARSRAAEETEQIRQQMAKVTKKVDKDRGELESKAREKALQSGKQDAANEMIRKLGALPSGIDEYEGMSAKALDQALKETRSKLKGLAHVNRKALDQYSQLAETRDQLVANRDARDKERVTLQKLIENLDAKKDEAVLRTFKQVKAGFAHKFKQLVGHDGAKAELSLTRVEDSKASGKGAQSVSEFHSVKVKVNFGVGGGVGGGGDKDMSRLSGGQKSLVALALIFAIQQCDPAPFYLFDEIDAALDAEYRTNVARMVQELSKEAQFLIVSFKKEMSDIADRHFAITFQNKVSRLQRCTVEEAHHLLAVAESEHRPRTPASTTTGTTPGTTKTKRTRESDTEEE